MDGFKNSTKTIQGHHPWDGAKLPGYATGGIVTPFKAPDRGATPMVRPVMPRPHVMPNMQRVSMPRRLAKGGKVGSTLEQPIPYSQIESEHPRRASRPGYKQGGIHIKPSHKGLFTKKMTGSKTGHLTGADVSKGLHSKSPATRKQANFARMARRGFKPLKSGGAVGYAEGGAVCDDGAMAKTAARVVARHVRAKPPQGHGVKPRGNLAFMSKPLIGD